MRRYLLGGLLLLWACSSPERTRDTGIEYAPQMYHSIPLEPYSQLAYNPYLPKGMNAQAPVEGTVARGKMDYYYPYPNTPEGYEQAGKELKNPLPYTIENIKEGKRLYMHFCVYCHGPKGMADGILVQKGKFPPPPIKFPERKDLPEGKMFHVITYGKGLMGSHASQLTPKQRWQIIQYIRILQLGTDDPKKGLQMLQDSLKVQTQ